MQNLREIVEAAADNQDALVVRLDWLDLDGEQKTLAVYTPQGLERAEAVGLTGPWAPVVRAAWLDDRWHYQIIDVSPSSPRCEVDLVTVFGRQDGDIGELIAELVRRESGPDIAVQTFGEKGAL